MGSRVLSVPGPLAPAAGAEGFVRRGGVLHCDDVALDALAREMGTPAYVYGASIVRARYRRLDEAFAALPHRLHFSVKANSNLAVLALLRELGAGVDIVSGGELFRALRAGFVGADIVFSGVGKTDDELAAALAADVRLINVESEGELRRLDAVAGRLGRRAPVALRVNPEVSVDTPHPYTRTGGKGMKFGIPWDAALDVGRLALGLPHIALVGLDMHIGSQVALVDPYRHGLDRLLELVAALRSDGAAELRWLDVGGGFAVPYGEEPEADVTALAAEIGARLAGTGLDLIVEPGRYLVAPAGVLLTRVLDRKHSGGKEFVITDAGMTELLRPSHYNAFHRIEPVVASDAAPVTVDVMGPVCESGDFLALERAIPGAEPGALLAVHTTGAYGFSMASNYNSRPRPPEVLVDGARFAVAREREVLDDLVRGEHVTPDWRNL